MRQTRRMARLTFLTLLLLPAIPATAHASHETNKFDVRRSLESDGWTVAYGKEIDQLQEATCVVEIAAAAVISGGTAAVLAGAQCLRDAAVQSVQDLPADLVKQALGHLGEVFSSGGLEVQANIATYNHKECLDFWPNTCVPTPNTYQAYIRFRGHREPGGGGGGADHATIYLDNQCSHPIQVALRASYRGEWKTWAWYQVPGRSGRFGPVSAMSDHSFFYYYAEAVDGSGLVWSSVNPVRIGDRLLEFHSRSTAPNFTGEHVVSFTCP